MPFKLKKLILLSLLFHFDVAESQTIQEIYIAERRNENHYLMSNDICHYSINYLLTACSVVFRYMNQFFPYKDQNNLLHLSYQAFIPKYLTCEPRDVQFDISSEEKFKQIIIACPGKHNPVQTSIELDTYIDEIYISYGVMPRHVMIYTKIKNWNRIEDYYMPKYHIRLSWDILLPIPIQHLYNMIPNLFELSFIEDRYEVQKLYVREKLDNISVDSIFQSEITPFMLFNLCITIIESTVLRNTIIMKDEDADIRNATKLKHNKYYVKTPFVIDRQKKTTTLYDIPGSLNRNMYKISSTSRSQSLLFYELQSDFYIPILLVQNVFLLYHSDQSDMDRATNYDSDTVVKNYVDFQK